MTKIEWDNYEVDIFMFNEVLYESNSYDDEIFEMDALDEVLDGKTPTEIINLVHYGDYDATAGYFKFNGYGNILSIDSYDLNDYFDEYSDELLEFLQFNYPDIYEEIATDYDLNTEEV